MRTEKLIRKIIITLFTSVLFFVGFQMKTVNATENTKITEDTLTYDEENGHYVFASRNGPEYSHNDRKNTRINIKDYYGEPHTDNYTLRIYLKSTDSYAGYAPDAYNAACFSVDDSQDGNVVTLVISFADYLPYDPYNQPGLYDAYYTISITESSGTQEYSVMLGYGKKLLTPTLTASIPTVKFPAKFEIECNTSSDATPYMELDGIGGHFTFDSDKWFGADTYTGKITVDETEGYYKQSIPISFTVEKGDSTIVLPSDIKMGTLASVNPSVSVATPEGTENLSNPMEVQFKYKKKSDPDIDSSYSSSFPTTLGSYTCKSVLSSDYNRNYNDSKADFTISYLTAPDLVLSGRAGSNGYYTSDVTLKAPSGYGISTTYGSGYVDSLEYKDVSSKSNLYFKETSTGALSDKVSMPSIKIDKVIPVISGIKNSQTYYEASKDIVISDDNLDSATVNGKALTITDGKASTTLSANGGKTDYTVVAKDKAGLTVTYNVTLAAAWMEKGVIPTGSKVKLYKGTGYTLNAGKWKVSGDSTVYNGGQVFVASDKELTFSAE